MSAESAESNDSTGSVESADAAIAATAATIVVAAPVHETMETEAAPGVGDADAANAAGNVAADNTQVELQVETETETKSSRRLFQLSALDHFNTSRCAFCENGRRKVLALASDTQLYLRLLAQSTAASTGSDSTSSIDQTHVLEWETAGPLCWDPSGTWLAVLGTGRVSIVPGFALLQPQPRLPHDQRWPLDRPTHLTLPPALAAHTALVWWQTQQDHPVAIIGDQTGGLIFFSLQTHQIVRKSFIVGKVCELDIYVNDDDDNVVLLITSNKGRQWKLNLENRVGKDNRPAEKKKNKTKDTNKKLDDFLTTLKELGSDKMNSLFQMRSHSTSNVPDKFASHSNNKNPTPISLAPIHDEVCDLPGESCSKIDNSRWVVRPQSANGHHFVSIFNPNVGSFTLHRSLENSSRVHTYKFKDIPSEVFKIIWEEKMIFLFGTNLIEIHSSHFSSQDEDSSHTVIWSDFLEDDECFINAWIIDNSTTQYKPISIKWSDGLDVNSLDLPNFNLSSCLVVSNKKIYTLTTSCEILKWLVEQLIEGRGGVERMAAALKIPLRPLLIAAADILLARKRFQQAMPMFRIARLASDDILNRLGALGFYAQILLGSITPQSTKSADISLLVHVLHATMDKNYKTMLLNYIEKNNQFTVMLGLRLLIDLGMWDAVKLISFKKGKLWPTFQVLMEHSTRPCRGCLSILLQKCYAQFLVTDDALPFLKFIDHYCETFDIVLLKKLCIWMSPLQDCFRIVFTALYTSQPNTHLSKMRRLIRTYFGVISTLHSRISSSKTRDLIVINKKVIEDTPQSDDGDISEKNFPCVISCGHNHWGIACNGKIKLISTSDVSSYVDIDISLIGKVTSVACGRHHTLILTENGLYSLGNNCFGQLGIGIGINASDTPLLIGTMQNNTADVERSEHFAWYDEKVVQIAAGQYHSACVTDCGNLYTWGWGIHGQLALGTIYNEFIPMKVTALKSEKVSYVGCGSCHTAILTTEGNVYTCGNGAFGQIGDSTRHKSNIPIKVDLGIMPATMISVGYFHTLALLKNNEVWTWGNSPQKLRLGARSAKRKAISVTQKVTQDDSVINTSTNQNLPSPVLENDNHLHPTQVDTSFVKGFITRISAGWHHSGLVDSYGLLYVWGLNLDCQLGTGNCSEVYLPTNVNIPKVEYDEKKNMVLNKEIDPSIGCGGDFTVYVNSKGRVFVTGNTLVQKTGARDGEYKVLIKNTTRMIRVPNHHSSMQKTFRYVTVLEDMDYHDPASKTTFGWLKNPILSLKSFENKNWAIDLLKYLHQFIDDDTPLLDNHLRALLCVIREDFSEALILQLNNLYQENSVANFPLYTKHEKMKEITNDATVHSATRSEVLFGNIKLLQRLIRNVCRRILEENISEDIIVKLECLCKERRHLKFAEEVQIQEVPIENIENYAISITQSLFNMLPPNSKIWTECVDEATTFWIDHKLKVEDLEKILAQNVSQNTLEMGSAIFCPSQKVDYQKHMSSSFNLELCNGIIQTL